MIKRDVLDIVQAKCENCRDCVLGNTRKNVVFLMVTLKLQNRFNR